MCIWNFNGMQIDIIKLTITAYVIHMSVGAIYGYWFICDFTYCTQ